MGPSQVNAQVFLDRTRSLSVEDERLLTMNICDGRSARIRVPQGRHPDPEIIRQRKGIQTPFIKTVCNAGIIPVMKIDTDAKDIAGHPREKTTAQR